ncbi:MAG: hypothetical protein JNL57_05030 [Bacteroidetes bacterium]|nr:hypothetical protein [Bacteroidota bacterium]
MASIKKFIADHAFDFFTLFLAVLLGFFVDNYRDDLRTKQVAKELSADMINDIAQDTANINLMVKHAEIKKKNLETLFHLVDDGVRKINDSDLYVYSAHLSHRPWFQRNSSTFNLLINTGYLRNFTKTTASAHTQYNDDCENTLFLLSEERNLLNTKITTFLQQIFHMENFQSIIATGSLSARPELRNWTPENKWLFHNYVLQLMVLNERILNNYVELKQRAVFTLKKLGNDYVEP